MSLFIHCQWYPQKNHQLAERIPIATHMLKLPSLAAIFGTHWYPLAPSKKKALANPIQLEELENMSRWRKVKLAADFYYFSINLWNGQDNPHGISISIEINEQKSRMDTAVIDGPELKALRATNTPWEAVLSCGNLLAHHFGGLVMISSHEMIEFAQNHRVKTPELAAYAAFWPKNHKNSSDMVPSFEEKSLELCSLIPCRTWEEVDNPNLARIAETTKALIPVLQEQQVDA